MDTFVVLLFFVAPVASGITVQRTQPEEDVTLRCQVDDDVPIRAVEWTRRDLKTLMYLLSHSDGRSYPTNQHPFYLHRVQLVDGELKDGNASLILRNVTIIDNGIYECRVTYNRSGHNRGADPIRRIKLVVRRNSGIFVQRTQPGKDVTLRCKVDGDVPIRAVEWTRRDLKTSKYILSYSDGRSDPTNQLSSFKNRVRLVDSELKDGDASLRLRNVRVSDGGTYECRVTDGRSEHNKRNETDAGPIKTIKLEVTGSGSEKRKPTVGYPSRTWKIALKVVGALLVVLAAGVTWKCKRRLAKRSEEPAAEEAA